MELNKILCTGDPILDLYIGEDKVMRQFNGGALNIYQNILALLEEQVMKKGNSYKITFGYPNDGDVVRGDIYSCYTICRTPLHQGGIPLASELDKDIFYTPCGIAELIKEFKPNIVVFGDYNKGSLNDFIDETLPSIDYAVVDSRYKSLDLRWIETCKYKIWHATGDEYDKNWAENFDLVYWTNGPEPVKILQEGKLIAELEVPRDTVLVNTCGSGDTFTATIAASLHVNQNSTKEALIKYGEFAIQVCQDVVSRPYTSTTNKRIRTECLLLT